MVVSRRSFTKVIGGVHGITNNFLGKGSFGIVYEGCDLRSNQQVAVKEIPCGKDSSKIDIENEAKYLNQCSHPNIMKFIDLREENPHIYLITELCKGGDLAAFMKSKGKFPEIYAQRFSVQLANGLVYLHGMSFVHRDLKPKNLLLTDFSFSATLKIADFGQMRLKEVMEGGQGTVTMNTNVGSIPYSAPEILEGTGHKTNGMLSNDK